MRLTRLMTLFALAGGFAFATGCGGDTDKDTDVTGDDDDDTVGDDDDDTTTDTYTTPAADTALAYAAYVGVGTVAGGNYAGTESIFVLGQPLQQVLCEWTFDAAGAPSQAPVACADYDGGPCEFAFDVTLTNGRETQGDCVAMFGDTLGVDGGSYSYGYTSNYYYGGAGYGEAMMYYATGYGYWYWAALTTYDSGTGEWIYEWPIGYIAYVPE